MRLRCTHDVFGNSVAIAAFGERADRLTFTSTVTIDHKPAEEFALTPDDPAYFYPFLYDAEEFPYLRQFVTPNYSDSNGELSEWARTFLDAEAPTPKLFSPASGFRFDWRNADHGGACGGRAIRQRDGGRACLSVGAQPQA